MTARHRRIAATRRPVALLAAVVAGLTATPTASVGAAVADPTSPVTTTYSPTPLPESGQGNVGDLHTDNAGDVVWSTTSPDGGDQVRLVGTDLDETFGGTAVGEQWQMPTLDFEGKALAALVTPTDGSARAEVVSLTDGLATSVVPLPDGASAISVTEAPDGVHTVVVYRADDGGVHLGVWDGSTLADDTPESWADTPPVFDGGQLPIEVSTNLDASRIAYYVDGDPNGTTDPTLVAGCRPHLLVVTDSGVEDYDVGTDESGNQLPVTCATAYGEQARPVLTLFGTERMFFTVQATQAQPSDHDPVGGSWIDMKYVPDTPSDSGAVFRVTPYPSLDPDATSTTATAPLVTGTDFSGDVITYEDADLFEPYVTASDKPSVPTAWTRNIAECQVTDCPDSLAGLSRVITDTDGSRAWNGLPPTPDGRASALTVSSDGTTELFAAADPGVTGLPVDTAPASSTATIYTVTPSPSITLAPLGDITLTPSGDGTGTATVAVSATGLSGVAKVTASESKGGDDPVSVGEVSLDVQGDGTGMAQLQLTGATSGTVTAVLTDRDGRTVSATAEATLPASPPPDPVSNLRVHDIGVGTADLAWTDPTGATTTVHIAGGVSGDRFDRSWTLSQGTAHLHVTGLPKTAMRLAHPYKVTVTAVEDGQDSTPVTLSLTPSIVHLTVEHRRHNRVMLHLTLQTGSSGSPADALVALQSRRADGSWSHLRTVRLSSAGARTITFHVAHKARLCISFAGRGHVLGSVSSALLLRRH